MKYAIIAIITGLLITAGFNSLVEKYTGATIEELGTLKQECEAKLPRNKMCEMYFEYLPERE